MQEEITVTLKLAAVRRNGKRWSMQHQFLKGQELAAELTVDGTWLDFKTRRTVTPPKVLLDLMDMMIKTDDFQFEK